MDNKADHSKEAKVVVLMVPLPCQSHLNQLLQLACIIATYDLEVHFASSATHLRQGQLRFNHKNHLTKTNILFHSLSTPPFLSPPPDPNSPHKFPTHLLPSFESTAHLRQPVAELLHELSKTSRRVVVIHDPMVAYAVQDIATIPKAESYFFQPLCAFTSFLDGCQFLGKSITGKEFEGLPTIEGCYPRDVVEFVALQTQFKGLADGGIYNSSRSIEGAYIDIQAEDAIGINQKLYAIGPLYLQIKEDTSSISRHKCLKWLDKQDPKTVLYVSFGTTTTMTEEQIRELAMGLEKSKQKFIWVLRDADKGDIFVGEEKRALLRDGFEERVKEFGIVERDWAPQVEILGHPSVGGFMSHCGWNSCLESIAMGVPIAAWPMHSDQPKNAFLVTNILKMGLAVSRWEDREKLVNSTTISEAIKNLMASEKGEEMRLRVKKLSVVTQEAVKEGGVSKMELNSFISHITR